MTKQTWRERRWAFKQKAHSFTDQDAFIAALLAAGYDYDPRWHAICATVLSKRGQSKRDKGLIARLHAAWGYRRDWPAENIQNA